MEIGHEKISDDNFEEIGKTLIETNWIKINDSISEMLRNNIKILELKNIVNSKYKITIFLKNNIRKVIISDEFNNIEYFIISNKLRKIKFIYYINKIKHEKLNIILNPIEIESYIGEYNIKNPIYYLDNNIHKINSHNFNDIFENKSINEIIDLNMEDIPNSKNFMNYIKRCTNKVKDLYINENINEYCNKIFEGAYKMTVKRNEFENDIKKFIQSTQSELFLTGPTKIGKTISILNTMDKLALRYLYIDFQYIHEIKENDKNIYLFTEFFRLFSDYSKYTKFIKQNYELFKYSDNILKFIKNIIKPISNELFSKTVIIIDNYEDIYSKENLDEKLIEEYLQLLKENMKIIICGNGIFFNKLISQNFSDESLRYNFLYINNLELNIEIDSNEFIDYLATKYKNNSSKILFCLILFKKVLNSINGFEDFKNIVDFPSKFFIFNKQSKNVTLTCNFTNAKNFLENNIKI